jgi:hypothetical protein
MSILRSILRTIIEAETHDANVNKTGTTQLGVILKLPKNVALNTPKDNINEKNTADNCPYKMASINTNNAAGIIITIENGEENICVFEPKAVIP